MSFSDLNICVIFSVFSLFLLILWNPCSFKVNCWFNAICLIAVLNSFEPVKYNKANGLSSGVAYKKSTLRAFDSGLNLAINNDLLFPFVNSATIIFFDTKWCIKSWYISFLLLNAVNNKSISPESGFPRL